MTSDVGFLTPLKKIVAMAIDEEDKSMADFDKMWILGLRALTDMTFDIYGQPKTVRLPVNGNKTVDFPSFCLSWSKIGILDEGGKINTLKINNSLTTFRDTNPNRLNDLTPDINTSVGSLAQLPFYTNFYYNGGVFDLYGLGNGIMDYGECRVDETNRVVILSPHFKYDSIMFECISSPMRDDDYQVQTCLQEAIIMFIKWKLKLAKPQDYYGEVIKARRRLNNKKVILQSVNQVIRESNGMKLRS